MTVTLIDASETADVIEVLFAVDIVNEGLFGTVNDNWDLLVVACSVLFLEVNVVLLLFA